MGTRLNVLKTYKLFIDGKFPRTESGRHAAALSPSGAHLANYCRASRKDLREAVVAARKGAAGWAAASPFLRGQVLYRLAEMLESRGGALAEEIAQGTGAAEKSARQEIAATVDRIVYFAGWTDKVQQVFGAVNPVASSHFNFTVQEPMGVIGLLAPDAPCLLGAVTLLAAALAGGNAVVLVASERFPLPAISLAEVIATSDIPPGLVNILTGQRAELVKPLAEHMDVNGILDGSGDPEMRRTIELGSATNLKRCHSWSLTPEQWRDPALTESPDFILQTQEAKTAWHPIGV